MQRASGLPKSVFTVSSLALLGALVFGASAARSNAPCPDGMAFVPGSGFCVDRYEASLMEIRPDGREVPHSPYMNPGCTDVRAVVCCGVVPQGYIL